MALGGEEADKEVGRRLMFEGLGLVMEGAVEDIEFLACCCCWYCCCCDDGCGGCWVALL